RLSAAVSRLLRPLKLTWLVRDNGLFVTSRDAADRALVTEVYGVADLKMLPPNPQKPKVEGIVDHVIPTLATYSVVQEKPRKEYDALVSLITTTLSPDTWDESGGNGRITALLDSLAVRHRADVQQQVVGLLEGLRKVQSLNKLDPALRI